MIDIKMKEYEAPETVKELTITANIPLSLWRSVNNKTWDETAKEAKLKDPSRTIPLSIRLGPR